MSVEKHLESAAAFIAVAESGDSKRVAYERAADEIIAAQAEDSTLSNVAIGRRVGKSRDWVRLLVQWRTNGDEHRAPFASGEPQRRYVERQVPTRTEDRVEMARTLLEDDAVVEAVAAEPSVTREVETRQAERKFQTEQRRTRNAGMPLSAYFHRLIGAIRKTGRDLDFIRGELAELTDDERPKVDEALVELIAKAEACRLELDPSLKRTGIDEHTIIEGDVA